MRRHRSGVLVAVAGALAIAAALGVAGSSLVTTANAEVCRRRPDCDPSAPLHACLECDETISTWAPDDTGGGSRIEPVIGRSLGADRGATLFGAVERKVRPPPLEAPPVESFHASRAPATAAAFWAANTDLADRAATGRVTTERLLASWWSNRGGPVPLPQTQGGPRFVAPNGSTPTAQVADGITDPIDPVTGELVIEHVDLALPGFGVSFAHRRIYRSRLEYRGPLGPGWDVSYNQRLVAAPAPVSFSAPTTSTPTGPQGELPVPDEINQDPICGPVMLLSSGTGATFRFREVSRQAQRVTYQSDVADLSLVGTEGAHAITWELRDRGGEIRRFDGRGLLAAWTDANGIGLTFGWEPGAQQDWRLAAVTDSVGRRIEYTYDGSDRLKRVAEARSGMSASYEYGANGGLELARRADGRSERYEYDVQAGRTVGPWIPELQLERTCANACAVSSRSCDAGGACDAPVRAATGACLAACPACNETCTDACEDECSTGCGRACGDSCFDECTTPEKLDSLRSYCEDLYQDTAAAGCAACADACDAETGGQCEAVFQCAAGVVNIPVGAGQGGNTTTSVEVPAECSRWHGPHDLVEDTLDAFIVSVTAVMETFGCLGWRWPPWEGCTWRHTEAAKDQICHTDIANCCAYGDDCNGGGCTAGASCEDECKNTFLGFGHVSDCPAPGGCADLARLTPAPGSQEYNDLIECAGTASTWSENYGCLRQARNACYDDCDRGCRGGCNSGCRADCGAACAAGCHVNDCATYCTGLDLAGTCETSCTAACVDDAHASGPFVGPKYGYLADLNFNLVRVTDGNGALYLENTYGTDLASPDFDTVTAQRYGTRTAALSRVDLTAANSAPATWAAGMVAAPADFRPPTICPYACTAEPVRPPRHLIVPWGDVMFDFPAVGPDETPLGGWSFVKATFKATTRLAPTFVRIDTGGSTGTIAARVASRSPLDKAPHRLELALPEGTVVLTFDPGGAVAVAGDKAAAVRLGQVGGLTVWGDGVSIRVYPGRPTSAAVMAAGACTRPFHVERTGEHELSITPEDACDKGDLWTAPLASLAPDGAAAAFARTGQASITSSHFRPSALAPVRTPLVLVSHGNGRYQRTVAASSSAAKLAELRAQPLYASVPLFSAPAARPGDEGLAATEPLYVFHFSDETGPDLTYPPAMPPADLFYSDADRLDTVHEVPCDPSTPVGIDWGSGPRPTQATVLHDLHGAFWTYYADAAGRLVHTRNHDTGAASWMNYDPDGRVVGVLTPTGARQCLTYDPRGNLARVLDLPADGGAPIRRQLGWTDWPARMSVVWDPRDTSRILERREYDSAGNLRAVIAADGLVTRLGLVGGPGPDRSAPATVTGPDGAVTQIAYDRTNGTVRSTIVDVAGAVPARSEVMSDAAGRPTRSVSPLGLVQTFDWEGPLLHGRGWEADGLTRAVTYGYDDDAQVETITGARQAVDITYDATGATVTATRRALDGSLLPATRCQEQGPAGRILETVSAEGIRTRYGHDGEGRVTSIMAGALGPSAAEWDDACPARVSGSHAAGTIATYRYHPNGQLLAAIDARGLETTWQYDGFGRPIFERHPDGGSIRTGYDELSNVVWQAHYNHGSPPAGPPVVGTVGLVAAVELEYDRRARLVTEKRWHLNPSGVPQGDGFAVTTYHHDDVARTVSVTDDRGQTTRASYDGAGRPSEVRLPDGTTLTTRYDNGGRTVRTRRPGIGGVIDEVTNLTATGAVGKRAVERGTELRVLEALAYDDPFRVGGRTDASGVVTRMTYDAFDRSETTFTTLPDAGMQEQVKVGYDGDDRPVARTSLAGADSLPSSWGYGYDALGRLEREVDPVGAITATAYLGVTDLPETRLDPRGVRTAFTWAIGGELERAELVPPEASARVVLSYGYDTLGRMRRATRQDGGAAGATVTSTFGWDSLGNLAEESDDILGTTNARRHAFDGLGQRVRSIYGGEATVTRRFDALGRQQQLTIGAESVPTAMWEYGGLGGPRNRRLANGVVTGYDYDALSRLTGVTDRHTQTGALLASLEWELPLDGVPRRLRDQRGITAEPAVTVYGIDPLGRLAAEQTGVTATFQLGAFDGSAAATATALAATDAGRTQWAFDGRNNWTSRTVAAQATSYTRDARDAVTAIGATATGRDARGALVADDTAAYSYDALGYLASVKPTAAGGEGRRYQRDALGRVVTETNPTTGAVTRYGWDGVQLVFIGRPTGFLETVIAAEGLDQPVVTLDKLGARLYHHQDRQGSVYLLTDREGLPVRHLRYSAYGDVTLRDGQMNEVPASAMPSPFGYHGLPHDLALGLVDMRARTYRPALGRFLSPDPIGLAGGPSLFAFVGSAPLAFRDPMGLGSQAVGIQIGIPSPAAAEWLAGISDFGTSAWEREFVTSGRGGGWGSITALGVAREFETGSPLSPRVTTYDLVGYERREGTSGSPRFALFDRNGQHMGNVLLPERGLEPPPLIAELVLSFGTGGLVARLGVGVGKVIGGHIGGRIGRLAAPGSGSRWIDDAGLRLPNGAGGQRPPPGAPGASLPTPAAGGADDAVTGWRAVSRAEDDDIARYGFRPDPAGRSMESKWFSESRQGAEWFRKNMPGLDDVVEGRVPRSVYERSYRHPNIDGTGPGFCVECSDLPLITPVPK